MTSSRFSIRDTPDSGARNRGFDDAVAGRKNEPPVGHPQRAAYLQGWRRGNERREAVSGKERS